MPAAGGGAPAWQSSNSAPLRPCWRLIGHVRRDERRPGRPVSRLRTSTPDDDPVAGSRAMRHAVLTDCRVCANPMGSTVSPERRCLHVRLAPRMTETGGLRGRSQMPPPCGPAGERWAAWPRGDETNSSICGGIAPDEKAKHTILRGRPLADDVALEHAPAPGLARVGDEELGRIRRGGADGRYRVWQQFACSSPVSKPRLHACPHGPPVWTRARRLAALRRHGESRAGGMAHKKGELLVGCDDADSDAADGRLHSDR